MLVSQKMPIIIEKYVNILLPLKTYLIDVGVENDELILYYVEDNTETEYEEVRLYLLGTNNIVKENISEKRLLGKARLERLGKTFHVYELDRC